MQIAQDFLSRAPAENPAHSGLCKGFSTGTIGRKDKQDAQVIFEQFLTCPPRYEHEVAAAGGRSPDASIGRIVGVRSTEQSVGVILHCNHLFFRHIPRNIQIQSSAYQSRHRNPQYDQISYQILFFHSDISSVSVPAGRDRNLSGKCVPLSYAQTVQFL